VPQHIEQYSNSHVLQRNGVAKSIGKIESSDFNGIYTKISHQFEMLHDYIVWAKSVSLSSRRIEIQHKLRPLDRIISSKFLSVKD